MILAVRRKEIVISLSQIANFLSPKENTQKYLNDNTFIEERLGFFCACNEERKS